MPNKFASDELLWDGSQDAWEKFHQNEPDASLKDFLAGWGAAIDRLRRPVPFDKLRPGRYWAKFHPHSDRSIDRWKPVELVYDETGKRLIVQSMTRRWTKPLEDFEAYVPQFFPPGKLERSS